MTIDNTEQIKSLISGCEKGEFYMLQIMHRTKDGINPYSPDLNREQIIKTYFVSGPEYLDHKMPEIKALCEMFNARAVINLNRKSWKQISVKTLNILSEVFTKEDYRSVKSIVETAAGQTGACDKDKKWLIDVDTKDDKEVAKVMSALKDCPPHFENNLQAVIPTLHGYHLITGPFNPKMFKERYQEKIDIHENNPTILYTNIKL